MRWARRRAAAMRGMKTAIVTPDTVETWDMRGKLPVITTKPLDREITGLEVSENPDFAIWIDEVAELPKQETHRRPYRHTDIP